MGFGGVHVSQSVLLPDRVGVDLHSELLFSGVVNEGFDGDAFHLKLLCVHSPLMAALALGGPNSALS